MVICENDGNGTEEGKFPCAVCRKGGDNNSVHCLFCNLMIILSLKCRKVYLGNTLGARGSTVNSVITKVRSGWSKFRNLVPLLTSKGWLSAESCKQHITIHMRTQNYAI